MLYLLSFNVSTLYTVIAIILMFGLPIPLLILTKKVKFFNTIGAIALCYVAGFLISLIPVDYDKNLTQTVASVLVAVAIPLVLFSFDMTSLKSLAKKTVISFVLVIVSTVAISCAGFFVANAVGLQNANQLAGMTCGLYIGGTPNLIAIGNALLSSDNKASVIAAANTSDFFVGGVYFLLILTVIRPVYKKILGSKKVKPIITEELPANETDGDAITADGEATEIKTETQTEYDYKSIPRDKKSIGKLIGVIALAIGCLAVGAGLEILINGNMDGSLFIMITVSVLGIAFSFVKPIRNVKGSYQIGQYLILIFSIGLSMSIDLKMLAKEILPTLAFFACIQIGSILLHLLLCKIFKIDGGTALITSTAGIYGPPFIAPVANAYGERELIAPGIICGTFGLAIGNLIGIGIGALLALIV
ncbi:MAG: DUF819 family protein [Clostridia bacterium]|nr:DUF819 family protein [Clostridia bacterium]